MRRSGTIALALVSAVLLFAGAPDPRATEREPVSASAPAAFGEDQVVEQLRHLNSELSERQLRRIAAAVIKYSAKYRLSPELVTAVMRVESTARPWARSPKGALGLMQVMPHMAEPADFAPGPPPTSPHYFVERLLTTQTRRSNCGFSMFAVISILVSRPAAPARTDRL